DLHIAARPQAPQPLRLQAPVDPAAGRTEERIAEPAQRAEIEKLLEADPVAVRPLALPGEGVRREQGFLVEARLRVAKVAEAELRRGLDDLGQKLGGVHVREFV